MPTLGGCNWFWLTGPLMLENLWPCMWPLLIFEAVGTGETHDGCVNRGCLTPSECLPLHLADKLLSLR